MARKIVTVDEGLHLPPAVQAQLKSDLAGQFDIQVNAAQAAADNAQTASADALTAQAAAEAAAAIATAPVDTTVAGFVNDLTSDTREALNALFSSVVVNSDPVTERIEIAGAATASTRMGAVYRTAFMTTPWEWGFAPDASGTYTELWTRDNAYTIWHMPYLFSPENIERFVRTRLEKRSTSATVDPDGGTLGTDGANFVADKISNTGVVTFKYVNRSELPFMDGIAFTVLALHTHWTMTGSNALFVELKSIIDTCLAAIPRSANGCVYSNPPAPSVDYGFTDCVLKTGNVAYGTALQAWAYKMMSEMAGENGSGTYTDLREQAQDGLATLRKVSGWYAGSSINNAAVDDVWATALIVAEDLCSPSEAYTSAKTLRDAYLAGTITSRGWVRHLPVGQYWVNSINAADTFQNGGYWLTPIWDCYRAVAKFDQVTAETWASQAVAEVQRQYSVEGTIGPRTAPYEWFFGTSLSTAKGYTASAAIMARFTSKPPRAYSTSNSATSYTKYALDTNPGWTLTNFTYDAVNQRMTSSGVVDGDRALIPGTHTDVGISADVTFTRSPGPVFPGLFVRYVDANNHIWATIGGATNNSLEIYQRASGTVTALANVGIGASLVPGVTYRLTITVNGTTVRARMNGTGAVGTTTVTSPGQVGLRHGYVGAGTTTYDNIYVATLSGTIASTVVNNSVMASDVMMAHDGGILAPGDKNDSPLSGNFRLLGGNGIPVATGRAGAAPVFVSAALD